MWRGLSARGMVQGEEVAVFDRWSEPEEADLESLVAMHANAFGIAEERVRPWHGRLDPQRMRVAVSGGEVVGGLGWFRMGHFLGGRSVPSAGVAGVAVRPHARGRGVAREMMVRLLREVRDAGLAISSLFAATHTLYRAVGYEAAGSRYRARLSPAHLPVPRAPGVSLRQLTEADHPALESVYAEHAMRHAGHLDRNDYLWWRVWHDREGKTREGVVAERDGRVTGYLTYTQDHDLPDLRMGLECADLVALDAGTGRALWAYLARHGSVVEEIRWFSAPADPMAALLPEPRHQLELVENWSVRVVDLGAALRGRGWAPGVRGEVHLRVEDEVLPDNTGDWVLAVEDGEAEVRRGGQGRVRVGPRGLAAVYTGFSHPVQAASAGLVEGEVADLHVLGALLAGPAPWMPEMF